jgi:hypothetical protein
MSGEEPSIALEFEDGTRRLVVVLAESAIHETLRRKIDRLVGLVYPEGDDPPEPLAEV